MKLVVAEVLKGLMKLKPALLLNQKVLAHIGIIYVDKIVHRSPNHISSKGNIRFRLEI